MHWIFINLVFSLFSLAPVEKHPRPAADGKIVSWLTETTHDFGEVRSGSTVQFSFKFQNLHNEAIVLETVRTTCGCTAADWTEAPVEPGQQGQVDIEFDAGKGGSFRKKITVFFDKQRKPEVLWIEGEVE